MTIRFFVNLKMKLQFENMNLKFSSLIWSIFIIYNFGNVNGLTDIVGGKPITDVEDFSYQVSIHVISGQTFCGGVIINENNILTAAHCVCVNNYSPCPVPAQSIYIMAGTKSLTDPPSTSVIAKVKTIFVHDRYVQYTYSDDIAILRLEKPLIFTSKIRSIPLAASTPLDGTDCIVSGFGMTTANSATSNTLLQANVKIISHDECSRYYPLYFTQICAGGQGTEPCHGDSGGPLKCNGHLAGISSYTVCGVNNYPSGYTDVAQYKGWIKEQLQRTISSSLQYNVFLSAASYVFTYIYTIGKNISRMVSYARNTIFGIIRSIFPFFF